MPFERYDYEHTAKLLRSDNDATVRATLSNNINIIIAALDLAASNSCCTPTADMVDAVNAWNIIAGDGAIYWIRLSLWLAAFVVACVTFPDYPSEPPDADGMLE